MTEPMTGEELTTSVRHISNTPLVRRRCRQQDVSEQLAATLIATSIACIAGVARRSKNDRTHWGPNGLTGDWLLTRPLSLFREPSYLEMRQNLCSADAVFANFESPVHDYHNDPFAQRTGGGSYMTTEPSLLADARWMGVNLVACGSSHADDYGPKGIMETKRHFDAVGIVNAGSGRHLAEARSPGFLETPNGRIALVAASAQFRNGSQAGRQATTRHLG